MQQSLNNQLPQIISLPSQQYPNRQFQIIKKIGQGSEGEVFIAKPLNWFMNMRDVALKFQTFIQEREIQFIDNLIKYQNQENQLSQDMRSQIVKVYERTNFQGKNVLIMEVGEKDLYEWMKQEKGKCSILKRVQILKEISCPIRFLHFNQMFHRDIKPENYLKVGDEFKLIDFGLIKTLNDGQQFQSAFVGAPAFQPPEIVQGSDQYSQEVDIWSLGATFVEVLTDNQFQSNLQDYQFQTTQDVIINPQTIISLNNLLKGMLQQEPAMRINIIKVMQELQTIESQIQSNLNNKVLGKKQQTFNFIPQPLPLVKDQQNLPVFPFQPNNKIQFINQGIQQNNKEVFQGSGEILKELKDLRECTNELKQQLESNKKLNLENFILLKTSQEGQIEKLSQQNNQILETLHGFIDQTTNSRIKQENNLNDYLNKKFEQKEQLIIQNRSSLVDEIKNIADQLIQERNASIQAANNDLRNLTYEFKEFVKFQNLQQKQLQECFERIPNFVREVQYKLEQNLQEQPANQNIILQSQKLQHKDDIFLPVFPTKPIKLANEKINKIQLEDNLSPNLISNNHNETKGD